MQGLLQLVIAIQMTAQTARLLVHTPPAYHVSASTSQQRRCRHTSKVLLDAVQPGGAWLPAFQAVNCSVAVKAKFIHCRSANAVLPEPARQIIFSCNPQKALFSVDSPWKAASSGMHVKPDMTHVDPSQIH